MFTAVQDSPASPHDEDCTSRFMTASHSSLTHQISQNEEISLQVLLLFLEPPQPQQLHYFLSPGLMMSRSLVVLFRCQLIAQFSIHPMACLLIFTIGHLHSYPYTFWSLHLAKIQKQHCSFVLVVDYSNGSITIMIVGSGFLLEC